MEKDENTPLPSREQIDAILKFRPMFSPSEAKHLRFPPRKPGQFPFTDMSEEAWAFYQALYKEGFVVGFDCGKWQDDAKSYVTNPARLGNADLLTIRRLLTLHVRKERFCDGHFAKMIDNGHIPLVLRRLANIRIEMDGGFVMDDLWSELSRLP